jgi:hypothetical protein
MTAALEMLRASAPVDAHTLTEEELDHEMRDIFDELEPQLVACKGNVRKELRVVRVAFDRYCEARAAAADVIPEAYFGHQIEGWNTRDDAQAARWSEHLTTVQDESN